ncbi:ribonuclease H-like domain-containing protein [Tanacetum coccineum]|uniref:Ribonuclease H-like domain-containing protein n=1 Tax=Tanacetum coccineum TaxID=301880 RepID=A0ABQ4ZG84_9ASTR
MNERKKHFTRLRVEEQRRKPLTKAQKRNQICTYLKNMAGFTHNQLKNKSFQEIQKAFDKTMSWINSFKPMDSEVVKGSKDKAEGSKKRTRKRLDEESVKRQKLEDDAEKADLKLCLEIVPNDDKSINIEPLATKLPIVEWKTQMLGGEICYHIKRADGSSKMYKVFTTMFNDFDRQDLIDLYRLVTEKFMLGIIFELIRQNMNETRWKQEGPKSSLWDSTRYHVLNKQELKRSSQFKTTRPEGSDRLLWGDLMTIFEPSEEDELWRNQQDYTLISWELYDSCGVHSLLMDTVYIHMLVEIKYPLTQLTLERMLNGRLQVDHECEMAYGLLQAKLDDFKLTDESHVLLKVPRKDNMYSVDLRNVVLQGGLTCLFAKASSDESNLWHRRLGHVNFKIMNKLVRGNLVRGLPSKLLEINQSCVACQKGKQHRASCKFDGKANEGFFVGYSTNSKAFRVFNSRTRIVEENLHVKFNEYTTNIEGSGPNWLFDIDALTKSMNYEPVVAGNQSNGNAAADPPLSQSSKDSLDTGFKPSGEEEKKDTKEPGKKGGNPTKEDERVNQENDASINSTNTINTVNPTVNVAGIEDTAVDENIIYGCADDPNIPTLEEIVYSDNDEDVDAEADMNNLDTYIPVSPILTTRVHKDHLLEQLIGDLKSSTLTRRIIEAIRLFLAYASFKDLMVYQMDVNSVFLYGKVEVEVYVGQPPGFEDPDFPDRVYKVEKAVYGLHQAPRAKQLIESHKSSTEHPIVNEFIIINIPEEDVEPEPNLPLQEIIILDPDDQPMWENAKIVAPTPNSAIVQPNVDDNFVINSTHLKMISENKFGGIQRADPHDHIREFLAICNMFKYGETHSEALRKGNASKNDDTPMCERHEANYIKSEDYQNRNSYDSFSHQSLHDPNDSKKSLIELNNDVRNDLEDFKRLFGLQKQLKELGDSVVRFSVTFRVFVLDFGSRTATRVGSLLSCPLLCLFAGASAAFIGVWFAGLGCFVGLSGCHDGSGNGLTKTSMITHLRDRHCKGDAQAITKQTLATNFIVFDEAEVTFKRMGLWLCGVCFKTHTLRSKCRHSSSDFIPPPDCGDGIVRFVLYDFTKPSAPSSSDPLDHVDGLGQDMYGGFTLTLLDRLLSKGLRTVKSIPPKSRLGFSKVLKGALDKVICTPDDISCWVSLLVLPLCLLKTFSPRSNLECKSATKRQRQEECIASGIRSWGMPGGCLQLLRETLAEPAPSLSDTLEEDLEAE